jgi:hypothetical protein
MLQNDMTSCTCGCDNVSVCRFHYTNPYLNKPFNFASNMQYTMYKHSIYRIGIKIITQAWLGERSEFCIWAMAKPEPSWAAISRAISKWLLAGAKPSDAGAAISRAEPSWAEPWQHYIQCCVPQAEARGPCQSGPGYPLSFFSQAFNNSAVLLNACLL